MVAKISFGSSLYGALAYNGEKINKEEGKLLATNKIFDDCSGKTSIANALRDFQRYLSPHIRTEKPVVHISLNPHPDDVLTDMEMENIAREYLERMGYGNQPYMVYKHEDIDRHHMHIVTIRVDENGKCLDSRFSANAIQEHFSLHYENEQPIPLTIPTEDGVVLEKELQSSGLFDEYGSGLGLMSGGGSSNEAQEAAFDRELRRKKKKRKGRSL